MPRLLSSYAANKRVEDGLKKKQEQIRKDYMRATHRHLDETDKLVDQLIQIHVRTPSVFQHTPTGSASSHHRKTPNLVTSQPQPPNTMAHQPPFGAPTHHGSHSSHLDSVSAHQYPMMRGRPRGPYQNEGTITTDDSTVLAIRRDVPPPVIQVRGEEVFYQYDCRPNTWKKLEPTYKTKVLLHRNRTVSNALKHYEEHRRGTSNQELDDAPANKLHVEANQQGSDSSLDPDRTSRRRSSAASRRASLYLRRGSEFPRRASRRGSRFFQDEEEDEDRIPPITELKPQLSPGHTPRMLDGWTIMNWFLWKKPQQKPVWATKRYVDRKSREYKRYQASKSANVNGKEQQQQVPPKPSSAHSATREARRKESIMLANENVTKFPRAKSVPVHRNSSAIDEVDEDDEEDSASITVDGEKGTLRPTTSVFRLSSGKKGADPNNRPKTTHQIRRVALDTFTAENAFRDSLHKNQNGMHPSGVCNMDNMESDNSEDNNDDDSYSFREMTQDVLILRPKKARRDGSANLNRSSMKQTFLTEYPDDDASVCQTPDVFNGSSSGASISVDKAGLMDRMPNLAATKVTVQDPVHTSGTSGMSRQKTPALRQPMASEHVATPLFPKVMNVMPELGSDSPR